MDTRVTDHLLSTTRAVRMKLDLQRPVEDSVIADCLRLALQAPTPGGAQAWRWLVVRDQAVKDAVGALFRSVGSAYLAAARAAAGPVAYTTVPDFKPPRRAPVEQVAFLGHWGTPLT